MVVRDRIELPTRGFSVQRSNGQNYLMQLDYRRTVGSA